MHSARSDNSIIHGEDGGSVSLVLPGSPFQRLTALLSDHEPGQSKIDLGVGEPKHEMPTFVAPVLAENVTDFGRYPPIKGTPGFRTAVVQWLNNRYSLNGFVDEAAILPLNGSREGLFYALFEAKRRKPVTTPLVFSPNPFYQTYAAAAQAAGCRFLSPPESASASLDGLPDFSALSSDDLQQTVAVYIASPANPQGSCAPVSYWQDLIALARQHNFMIFADECYSEIYRDVAPYGVLEAAKLTGSTSHVISFNSLSKRSNLPGLRVGFMAGDTQFVWDMAKFRNMAAPQVPLPLQAVAATVYADEAHVAENRRLYNEKFELARSILSDALPLDIPDGGFFLWADCSSYMCGEDMALHLWKMAGLRVVPGAYLTADELIHSSAVGPKNRSDGRIRVALVHNLATTRLAMTRFRQCLDHLRKKTDPISQNRPKQTGKSHA